MEYQQDLCDGFDHLCPHALRNRAEELGNAQPCWTILQYDRFIDKNEKEEHSARTLSQVIMMKKQDQLYEKRSDKEDNTFNMYSFHDAKCSGEAEGGRLSFQVCIVLDLCLFCRRCVSKAGMQKCTSTNSNHQYVYSTPTKVKHSIESKNKKIKQLQNSRDYHKKRYEYLLKETGVDVKNWQSQVLFGDCNMQEEMNKFVDNKVESVTQKDLIQYIANESFKNATKARGSGKKTV